MRFDMSFDATNIMPFAIYEEELENKARRIADFCKADCPDGIPSEELEQMLKTAGLWDIDLPQYICDILLEIKTIM